MTPADLTEAEENFRALLTRPAEYSRWAAEVRTRWEASPEGKAALVRCHRDIGGFRLEVRKERAA